MKHMKFCSRFSVIGFVLSLFFGIFSKSGFFKVVLIALVWAIAFFALGMLISFVFDKFLAVETSEYDSNMPQSAGGAKESVGKNVDIVIQDQELDRSESSNKYNIGDKYQMLNDSDLTKAAKLSEPVDNGSAFVPVRNLETLTNISGTEAVKPSEIASKSDSLDELPDMGDVSVAQSSEIETVSSGDSDGELDSIPESSFSSYTSKKNESAAEVQDASILAKAISSILADES